jgi:hypothetical protein
MDDGVPLKFSFMMVESIIMKRKGGNYIHTTHLVSRPQLKHTAHERDASNCLKNTIRDRDAVGVRNLNGEHVTRSTNIHDVIEARRLLT